MSDKRTTIIHAAMHLFSEKGVHATSMQEIADESNVSKGTIYTYFSSKDDLLFSIFKYFHERMKSLMILPPIDLPPKEKFIKQIDMFIQERKNYKGFFKMIHREQLLTVRKDLHQLIVNIQFDMFQWLRTILLDIYGDKVNRYLPDGVFMLESLISGYLKILMLDESLINVDRLAQTIVHRVDIILKDMMQHNAEPLIPADAFDRAHAKYVNPATCGSDFQTILAKMRERIAELDLPDETKRELQDSIEFIRNEAMKEERQNFLIKGVLNNFDRISPLAELSEKLRQLLKI